jgi:hypothetical protein
MRYSLWSHNRLLGHTDLDIPCVTKHLMQGFIEPTPEGSRHLPRATGVPRAASAGLVKNLTDAERRGRQAEFHAAVSAREELDLELRLEDGTVFPCDFIRVYDLRDDWLSDESLDDDEPLDPELQAAVDADVAAWEEDRRLRSASAPPVEDPRWDTMQYLIQVYLKGALELDELLESPDFDDA